jgi:hypothetical protein
MATTQTVYVPGVCNIGGAEIRQRLRFGWGGLVVTVVLAAAFFVFRLPAPWRFFLFLPTTSGAVGFLQAAFRFCADFGMRSVFNLGPEVGT